MGLLNRLEISKARVEMAATGQGLGSSKWSRIRWEGSLESGVYGYNEELHV